MRVLAISGSLRPGSHNTALLDAAARHAPAGVEVVRFDGLEALPHYREDLDTTKPPASVHHLRESIATADALLVATPEYNGTMPGVLKNAIDWASRPFPANALEGLPTAVVGATTGGFGAAWAQADARKSLGLAGARVLERGVSVPSAPLHLDPDGGRRTRSVDDALAALVTELVADAVPAPG